jgi:ADP-ribose pyrophosphatase YjhB (NUDIX family)
VALAWLKQGRRYLFTLLGILFRRPLVGVCLIPLLGDRRIVLVRRRDNGCWGLPGGMLEWGETIEQSVRRELQEETGLRLIRIQRLVGVYSHPQRDPRFHSVCVLLVLETAGEPDSQDALEIEAVRAFAPEEISLDVLAHDHQQMLGDFFSGRLVVD